LLVEPDWAVAMIGLDLIDQLMYPMLYRRLDEASLLGGAGGYSLMAQHLNAWFVDQRRWLDALYKAWRADPEHGAANAERLAEVTETWLPRALTAVRPLAEAADGLVGSDCVPGIRRAATTLRGSEVVA
jgi:phenol hydroxylase P1 protein